jgi:hypothetical protein
MISLSILCRALVGLVFAASGAGKLATRERFKDFVAWLGALPLPLVAARRPIASLAAGVEVGIVVLVAVPATATVGLVLAAAVLSGFAGVTLLLLQRGSRPPCQCFGRSDAPLGIRHVVRDLLLVAAAVVGALTAEGASPAVGAVIVSLFAAALASVVMIRWEDLTYIIVGPSLSPSGGDHRS